VCQELSLLGSCPSASEPCARPPFTRTYLSSNAATTDVEETLLTRPAEQGSDRQAPTFYDTYVQVPIDAATRQVVYTLMYPKDMTAFGLAPVATMMLGDGLYYPDPVPADAEAGALYLTCHGLYDITLSLGWRYTENIVGFGGGGIQTPGWVQAEAFLLSLTRLPTGPGDLPWAGFVQTYKDTVTTVPENMNTTSATVPPFLTRVATQTLTFTTQFTPAMGPLLFVGLTGICDSSLGRIPTEGPTVYPVPTILSFCIRRVCAAPTVGLRVLPAAEDPQPLTDEYLASVPDVIRHTLPAPPA
jgi:hypothetical protein